MNSSLVSVIIPTHNRASLLKKALESVQAQSYSNIEIIVVNDCSTDETSSFLSDYATRDVRIRVVNNEINWGFVRSLNRGIQQAKGEYIARIDDDDVWIDKDKIRKQVEFLDKNKNYAVVSGGIIRVDEEGKEISRGLFPETDKEIRKIMLIADPIVHVATMFRKKDWEIVGGYDEQFDYAQDWELWMKLGKYGKYYNFQDYFVRSIFSTQGRSSSNMRHHLWMNMVARKRHRDEFPHFWKGYMLGWISYFFFFIPIRVRVSPWFVKMRELIVR